MAHEIAKGVDGQAAMFSVRDTPWHRLGRVLHSPPSTMEALALAGADFQVDLRSVYADVSSVGNALEPRTPSVACLGRIQGRCATVRLDTMQALGIVSERYTPLQNSEAFAILDPLVSEGRITLETGGVLRDGADVWLMARFALPPRTRAYEMMGEERIDPYFLLANNHSGDRSVLCALTPIRVVCANTLGLADRLARKSPSRMRQVRHLRNVESRVREAADSLFDSVLAQLDHFVEQHRVLNAAILSDSDWKETVLDRIAPLPAIPRSARGRNLYERHLHRALQRRGRLTWLWEKGPGHKGNHSAWEAYQAVTHSIDHDETWGEDSPATDRLGSLLNGHHAKQKRSALEGLYSLAMDGHDRPKNN
jgi:phage/plasmid-like protein (TIGR03299 family)